MGTRAEWQNLRTAEFTQVLDTGVMRVRIWINFYFVVDFEHVLFTPAMLK